MQKDPLVFSTDSELNKRCPKCKALLSECTCPKEPPIDPATIKPQLRIETVGRSGKPVTVIDRLPKSVVFLRQLSHDLKKHCGSGGTYRINRAWGMIEIQGDKREEIRTELARIGIVSKG
jgi:translation initiation factor 1